MLPMEKGAFYGIKNDWADKKVRLQNRRRQFEYYPDQWCLRLAGRKRRRKNNAYVDGWLSTSKNMVRFFIALALAVIIMLAPIFSGEYEGVDNIILTSKYGKTK